MLKVKPVEPVADAEIDPLLELQLVTLEGVAVTVMVGVDDPTVTVVVLVHPLASLAVTV
mgnify:CR=1 FL=1